MLFALLSNIICDIKTPRKKVVILLPTFNEKDIIEEFIFQVLSQQKKTPDWNYEILIVDSRSTDGTQDIAEKLSKRHKNIHLYLVRKGLGVAFIMGHKYAIRKFKPEALMQLDADGQTVPNVIPRLLRSIDDGYDFVIGSRFVKGGKNKLPLFRKIFSQGSSFVCRYGMGHRNIKEFSNSTRAFTPTLFKKINLELIPWKERTYIVLPSFLHAAIIAGAKHKEVPVTIIPRKKGYSKMRIVRYAYDLIAYTIDVRLKKIGIPINFFNLSRKFIDN